MRLASKGRSYSRTKSSRNCAVEANYFPKYDSIKLLSKRGKVLPGTIDLRNKNQLCVMRIYEK